jgi:hypothetical protein
MSRTDRSVSAAKRKREITSQRGRGKTNHVPELRAGRKTQPPRVRPEPQLAPATGAVHEGVGMLPAAPVGKPADPLLIESRLRLQRRAARSPLMPHGTTTIRPMPPRSGKPLWRRPHSS